MSYKDKESFLNYFKKKDPIPFQCPYCDRNSLRIKEGSWYQFDQSNHGVVEGFEDPEYQSFAYHTVYECVNPNCFQEIFSSGTGHNEYVYDYDNEIPYSSYFQPKFFQPPLHFFQLPEKLPIKIKQQILLSFSLVLQSPTSAVNSLRIALEDLLDLKGIQKNQKRSLHKRIEEDVPNIPELAPFKELFMAIKWLGNSGSHGDNVELVLILYVYEVLELILKSLYSVDRTAYLNAVAQATNLAKRALTPQELSQIPQD